MKRFERGVLLFLVLILMLSAGISYLGLNQATKSKANKDEQKMTVALLPLMIRTTNLVLSLSRI
jgi:hypothetical protein